MKPIIKTKFVLHMVLPVIFSSGLVWSLSALAQEQESGELPDTTQAAISPLEENRQVSTQGNDQTETLSVENELNEVNKDSYEFVDKEASQQTKNILSEVKRLQAEAKRTHNAADLAKKRAEIQQKLVQLAKSRKSDAQASLVKTEGERKRYQKQLERLKTQVSKLESKASEAKSRRQKAEAALKQARIQVAEQKHRAKRAKMQIEREQKKRQALSATARKLLASADVSPKSRRDIK